MSTTSEWRRGGIFSTVPSPTDIFIIGLDFTTVSPSDLRLILVLLSLVVGTYSSVTEPFLFRDSLRVSGCSPSFKGSSCTWGWGNGRVIGELRCLGEGGGWLKRGGFGEGGGWLKRGGLGDEGGGRL